MLHVISRLFCMVTLICRIMFSPSTWASAAPASRVAGRPTRVSLRSSGCPFSLAPCAHCIFIAVQPCWTFCLVMWESSWALTLFFRLFFFFTHTYGSVSEMCISEPLIQIVQPIWDRSAPALCVVSSLSEGPFWSCCSELLSPATVTNQDCFLIVWTQFGLSNLGSCVSPSCALEDKAVKESLYWGEMSHLCAKAGREK